MAPSSVENKTTKRSTGFWLGIWLTVPEWKLHKYSTVFWRCFLGEKRELLCFGIYGFDVVGG